MTAPQMDSVSCPKCGGQMWDNRVGKRNPKSPDFKCKDRSCDGVIWPPRAGGARQAPTAQQRSTPQPISAGPPLPYETEAQPIDQFSGMVELYKRCVVAATTIATQHSIDRLTGDTAGAVAAMSATLFIGAKDRGIR